MTQLPSVICRWLAALVFVTSGMNLIGQPPRPNSLVIPQYPVLAKLALVEGTIVVEIEIGSAGLIQSLKLQEHDKKLSQLAYAVVTSVSKWRLVDQANQKLTVSFIFQLLPYDTKDLELETKIDLFSSITIKARKGAPLETTPLHEPAPKKP